MTRATLRRLARVAALGALLMTFAPVRAGQDELKQEASEGGLRAEWYFQEAPGVGRTRWPTHLYRDPTWEIITDLKGSRLIYRRRSAGEPWQVSPVDVCQSHAVERMQDGRFIVADTDRHRVVTFAEPGAETQTVVERMAGLPLLRPHDTVRDPRDGLTYLVDSHRRVYRLRCPGMEEQAWQFTPSDMGYARSLSFFDGAMHVINSADGEVLRLDDFEGRCFTRFRSFGKKRRAPAGAFATTGFVLNDVEKWRGWYYGTNYFCPSYAEGADSNVLRFVRWKDWEAFAAGEWEDLSPLLPSGMVPYFLTAGREGLFVAVFDHEADSERDGIVLLQPAVGASEAVARPAMASRSRQMSGACVSSGRDRVAASAP